MRLYYATCDIYSPAGNIGPWVHKTSLGWILCPFMSPWLMVSLWAPYWRRTPAAYAALRRITEIEYRSRALCQELVRVVHVSQMEAHDDGAAIRVIPITGFWRDSAVFLPADSLRPKTNDRTGKVGAHVQYIFCCIWYLSVMATLE